MQIQMGKNMCVAKRIPDGGTWKPRSLFTPARLAVLQALADGWQIAVYADQSGLRWRSNDGKRSYRGYVVRPATLRPLIEAGLIGVVGEGGNLARLTEAGRRALKSAPPD